MANNGLEEGLGGIQWELVGCLGLGWLMVYLIVWKGLHQSGKVIDGSHTSLTCHAYKYASKRFHPNPLKIF